MCWALSRGKAKVDRKAEDGAPFGVRVEVRPPHGRRPVWGGLVKGIFDGVICAFQAHTDTPVDRKALKRLAKILGLQPTEDDDDTQSRDNEEGVALDEIANLLCAEDRNVLGGVPRLVASYQSGVKFDPAVAYNDVITVPPRHHKHQTRHDPKMSCSSSTPDGYPPVLNLNALEQQQRFPMAGWSSSPTPPRAS